MYLLPAKIKCGLPTLNYHNQLSELIKICPYQIKTYPTSSKNCPNNTKVKAYQSKPAQIKLSSSQIISNQMIISNQTKLTVACPNELNAYPTKSKPEEKKISSPISIDTCPNYRKQILPILFIKSQPKLNQNQWYIFYNTWHKNICNRNTS